MKKNLLHTPDGFRDIYSNECETKLILEKKLRAVLNEYGYRDIETPSVEFAEVFDEENGSTPAESLYRFFDREGHMMVLRPDFTPSIARAAVKYYPDCSRPVRLSYLGNTFVNNSSYQGRLKETTQVGAELILEPSASADAEIIAMVIQALLSSGLKDFQISLGHVRYFEALAAAAGLDEEATDAVQELIRNKNSFGVEKYLADASVSEDLKETLKGIPTMFGSAEILDKAAAAAEGCEEAIAAINRLRSVYDLLKVYELERYVSFDLGMMSSYQYYTGIIFRGYTYGTGEAVVKGGRYDTLLENFGKDAPSVGFVVMVDQLMNALSRQKIEVLPEKDRYLILYKAADEKKAIKRAMTYRTQGKAAEIRCIADDAEAVSDQELMREGDYIGVIRVGGV